MIADPSHASGDRELVPVLSRVAVAAGADGLIVEVHPNPDKAWSDAEQTLSFTEFDEMMASLEPYIALRAAPSSPATTGARDGDRGMNRSLGRCAAYFPLLALLLCGFGAPANRKLNIPVIVTAAPAYDDLPGCAAASAFRGALNCC